MKNKTKKIILTLSSMLMAVICVVLCAAPASAASYPIVFLDTEIWGVDANNYAGEMIPLEFSYFPEYKNEKLKLLIYDSDGTLMGTAERTFYNSSSSMKTYTVNWNTSGYATGQYKLVMEKHFYSLYEWRRTPTDSTWYVTLKDISTKPKEGWNLVDGKWAYYENGTMIKDTWMQDSAGWCYLGSDGYMVTNKWVEDDNGWCYVGANGYCLTNTWKKDYKGWCYLGVSGAQVKNTWIKDDGKWYFIDAAGYMVANKWMKDSKGWCYLGASGAMKTNEWVKDYKGWCYVGANGYCVTNTWKKDYKGWCYLDSNGSQVKGEWVKDGGKWYYLDTNGYMVTGTKIINGKTYTFTSAGIWIG